jgi:hypothetical protein
MEMIAREVERDTINAHAAAVRASADREEFNAFAQARWAKETGIEVAKELSVNPDEDQFAPEAVKRSRLLQSFEYARLIGLPGFPLHLEEKYRAQYGELFTPEEFDVLFGKMLT